MVLKTFAGSNAKLWETGESQLFQLQDDKSRGIVLKTDV
jgi:hypothetical protein